MIPSTSKKVQPQQIERSEISILKEFLDIITERQKRAFITDGINFTENLIKNSTNSLPFEKNCYDISSIPLIREHLDSNFYYTHYKTCETSFADVPFNVAINPVKNRNTGLFEDNRPQRNLPTNSGCFLTFAEETARS